MDHTASARTPEQIGRYRIRRELGRGMMGVVYLADDPVLERQIALKTIDLAFGVPADERAAFEQRFLAEARVAARLSHPGIVVVHDIGRDEGAGTLYIALEYLQGRTLADIAGPGRPMEWRNVLRIAVRVARALHHAHNHNIVHRDIKPANIMLLPSGEPKIMDFGIAKVPHLELTSAGQFFGTPLYMSPEQALGQPVDGRADLFSLGAVTYLLLTGRQAFQAETVLQVLSRVAHEEPVPVTRLMGGIPADIDQVLSRLLAKDRDQRHANGEALATDLEDVLAGRPVGLAELPPLETEEDSLAGLLEPPPPPPPAAPASPPPPPLATSSLPMLAEPIPATVPGVSPSGPQRPRRRGLWIAAAVAAVLLAGVVMMGRGRDAAPGPPTARAIPVAPAPRKERAVQPSPREEPRAKEPAADEPAADEPARLVVDFEHHLRSGTIKVWLDDELVLDEELDSRVARKILSLRLRKGEVEETLKVRPGRHEVRVRVQWGDKLRSKGIIGNFEPGRTRELQVRVSRIFNELSLKWR